MRPSGQIPDVPPPHERIAPGPRGAQQTRRVGQETERTVGRLVIDHCHRLNGNSLIQWKPRLISRNSAWSARRSFARIFWPSSVPSSAIKPGSGCSYFRLGFRRDRCVSTASSSSCRYRDQGCTDALVAHELYGDHLRVVEDDPSPPVIVGHQWRASLAVDLELLDRPDAIEWGAGGERSP